MSVCTENKQDLCQVSAFKVHTHSAFKKKKSTLPDSNFHICWSIFQAISDICVKTFTADVYGRQ